MNGEYVEQIPPKAVEITKMPAVSINTAGLATEAKQDAIITAIGAIPAGGIQYTEADVDASITGTAMMMEGAGNTLVPAQGTAADGLLVNLGTNNDVTVTGTDFDIRNLAKTQDEVYAVLRTDAGTAYDARVLTSVPSHDVTNAGTFAVQNTEQGRTALGSNLATLVTPGTRVQLGSNACKKVTVQASFANSGTMIIGGSSVLYATGNGLILPPGASVSFNISNTNLLYIDADTASQVLGFVYEN
jgi:hypothetical protein